ncbi:MAG: AMP-binding protein, partial [Planctomycetaceae bacterium]
DAIAVVLPDDQVTYRELDSLATHWANQLVEHGARAGTVVGILREPSIESIATLLAVLKAGSICLPLDPDSPPQHLEAVVRAEAPLVLLTGGQGPMLQVTGTSPLVLERPAERSSRPASLPNPPRTPAHPACIIHSTG